MLLDLTRGAVSWPEPTIVGRSQIMLGRRDERVLLWRFGHFCDVIE